MWIFAYLDPGTGTIIVQAILGGVAGVAVLFKTIGRKFKRSSAEDASIDDQSEGAGDRQTPASSPD